MRASLLVALALLGWSCVDEPPRDGAVDLLIRGGTVVDGSGQPPRVADIAIDGGLIVDIGPALSVFARRVIDAGDRVVAPGFVDIHSHADLILLASREHQERLLGAKISQGVTTLIVGNCGLGPAPANRSAAEILGLVNGWMTPDGVGIGAASVADLLERYESGVVLNVGTLVPHGPLRVSVMGLGPGVPDGAQRSAMREALRTGLRSGAFGLSTGLIYPPGMYSETDELIDLARVVASEGGIYTTHVRGSSETLLPATHELIEIARASGAPVHHSHLEAVGRRFWPQVAEVLALEDAARAEGLRISHDVFPYTRAATMMAAIFPPWSLEGGVPRLLERLGDPEERARIRDEVEHRVPEWPPWKAGGWPHNLVEAVGWDGIRVASVAPGGPTEWVGASLTEIGRDIGRAPFDVVADLMISQRGRVGQFVGQISGDDDDLDTLLSILDHDAAVVVSDAEDYGRGAPHPAHAGAFTRALRMARQRELMPLQQIVRRMTASPAELLGIEDRGRLAVGLAADVVVLDPDTVTDRADWAMPRRQSEGIEWVVLNGQTVVEQGRYSGGTHGHVLRRTRSGAAAR